MIRMGVICPSEIAIRRFMPALMKVNEKVEFAGVGVASLEERVGIGYKNIVESQKAVENGYRKAKEFVNKYGGKIYGSYQSMVESDEIDALYLPLPPALHYKWARKALMYGKHILIEKPAVIRLEEMNALIEIAEKNKLAVHENYMFAFHEQINVINQEIESGELGEIRLYQICFGFPKRSAVDFRYNKELGGGALFDAGGYTIKYASMILGETARIICANMNYEDNCEVDLYGSGTLINNSGKTVQIAFGMDNSYMCKLAVWGSKGVLTTGRILTAPAGFVPEMTIKIGDRSEIRKLPEDDSFEKSIRYFLKCIDEDKTRTKNYRSIIWQARLMNDFREKAMR